MKWIIEKRIIRKRIKNRKQQLEEEEIIGDIKNFFKQEVDY